MRSVFIQITPVTEFVRKDAEIMVRITHEDKETVTQRVIASKCRDTAQAEEMAKIFQTQLVEEIKALIDRRIGHLPKARE